MEVWPEALRRAFQPARRWSVSCGPATRSSTPAGGKDGWKKSNTNRKKTRTVVKSKQPKRFRLKIGTHCSSITPCKVWKVLPGRNCQNFIWVLTLFFLKPISLGWPSWPLAPPPSPSSVCCRDSRWQSPAPTGSSHSPGSDSRWPGSWVGTHGGRCFPARRTARSCHQSPVPSPGGQGGGGAGGYWPGRSLVDDLSVLGEPTPSSKLTESRQNSFY